MITYNNKDILKFFIGNKRVVRKYLNNKIVYGTPDFTQYYNIQGYDNYEVVGNPTITDGMVSNFSSINYITVPAFSPSDNTWKIVTKFKLTDTTTNQVIFSNNYQPNRQIQLSVQNSKLKVYISTNGTSSNLANGVFGTYTISADTVYWVKFEFTGSAYIISYSVDGITWTTDIIINSTATLINVSNNMFFGKNTHPSFPEPLTNGSIIYLNDTYIEVNGQYWFNGNSNYKELLDCNPNVYLQSDGLGQYIQTNIHATGDTEVSTSFSVAQIETLSSIFSSRTSYNTANFGLSSREQGILTAYYNNSNRDIPNFIVQPNRRTYIDMIKNNISVDNVNYGTITNYTSFTASIPLRFFALATSTPSYFLNGKLYRTKIVNGNDKYDFVPVPQGLQIGNYKVPSNGMFDIVTQTFFENKGSGEFIWGVDL